MKVFSKKILFCVMLLVFALSSFAQNPCTIPPGTYRTQTQGGWGNDCHGNNPGCLRDHNFSAAFPTGITIGGNYTIHFTTADAVRLYLPAGTTPGVLTSNHVDPTSATEAGVFASQVLALTISVGFADAHVSGFGDLRHLKIRNGVHSPTGAFAGYTVGQFLAIANAVLGGNLTVLPQGITVSDVNDVCDMINNNFDDGTVSNGGLVETDCDEYLPVTLTGFDAAAADNSIHLSWTTASETNNDHFIIDRNGSELAEVVTKGNDASGHSYEYSDYTVLVGTTYNYTLISVDVNGNQQEVATRTVVMGSVPSVSAGSYYLSQNYPNPFNPTTTISFTLPEAGQVRLIVYDILGKEVARLADGNLTAATYSFAFDASRLSSGEYYYRLETGNFSCVRKLTLIK
jgi:hypothetical protein